MTFRPRDHKLHIDKRQALDEWSAVKRANARASAAAPLNYTSAAARLSSYWTWLGHRLRLSQPGRVLFTVALLVAVVEMVVARARGDREGGAPLVVLALLLIGVVTLDAVGRGVVVVVRRLVLDGRPRRHS